MMSNLKRNFNFEFVSHLNQKQSCKKFRITTKTNKVHNGYFKYIDESVRTFTYGIDLNIKH